MIPDRIHFFWIGRSFPFTHYLALRSVSETTRPAEIRLYLSDDLSGLAYFEQAVRDVPSLRVTRLDDRSLWEGLDGIDIDALQAAWRFLEDNHYYAALSDILRYLVLYRDGGVYLDLDTITLKSLRPLLKETGFCGRERILIPHRLYRQRKRLHHFRTVPLDIARLICSKADRGVGWFSRIAHLYPTAINGAVLGLEQGHRLALEALRRVPILVPELPKRRTIIGPDLLQQLIDEESFPGITVHPSRYFYPLGPYMAAHFFRIRKEIEPLRKSVIHHDTHIVHWYNDNLRQLARPPDPQGISELANRQLFSRLALPFLPQTSN